MDHAPGAYDAERASALSGVPRSMIHYWARNSVLVPTVSTTRVKLWSFADLMALRVIYWLRQKKNDAAGAEIPATGMRAIRRALKRVRELDEPLWHPEKTSIWIDTAGEVVVRGPQGPESVEGQGLLADTVNLLAPFTTREGLQGPDLARPRPQVRIVPGKLSGSPHIVGTLLGKPRFSVPVNTVNTASMSQPLEPCIPSHRQSRSPKRSISRRSSPTTWRFASRRDARGRARSEPPGRSLPTCYPLVAQTRVPPKAIKCPPAPSPRSPTRGGSTRRSAVFLG